MEHPFATTHQLSKEQTESVSGAATTSHIKMANSTNTHEVSEEFRKFIRPPMATTQAIGEEGGSFPAKADF